MAAITQQERRELEEMASVFERILEANPLDVGALEGLRDVYTRLGDAAKHAAVSERLATVALAKKTGVARAPGPALAPPARRKTWRLGELLVAEKVISSAQLQELLQLQRARGEKLGALLLRRKLVTEDQLTRLLSRQFGIPWASAADLQVDIDVRQLLPAQLVRKYDVLPLRRVGDSLELAMTDPTNVYAIDEIAFFTNLRVSPLVASQSAIRQAIDRYYPAALEPTGAFADLAAEDLEVVGEEASAAFVDVFELKESADQPPVVRLVNGILADAIQKSASDIHLEPYDKVFRVRFRVDGVLHEITAPPKKAEAAAISRIKIMSNLDIAERRLPQDGRIKLRYNQREIDFRVSILPTIFGE
ncbi:MAG: GspE/PulE family protein, partial [Candidatus Rokuibacteriota bacterium]